MEKAGRFTQLLVTDPAAVHVINGTCALNRVELQGLVWKNQPAVGQLLSIVGDHGQVGLVEPRRDLFWVGVPSGGNDPPGSCYLPGWCRIGGAGA